MSDEEGALVSSDDVPEEKNTKDDAYPNAIVPFICCTILVLLINMIVLLLTLSSAYFSEQAAGTIQIPVNEKGNTSGHGIGTEPSATTEESVLPPVVTTSSMAKTTTPESGKTVTPPVVTTAKKSTTRSTPNFISTTTKATTQPTTTSTITTTAFPFKPSRPGKPPRRYTLICAFEYIVNKKWPSLHQCTDYVYVRTFNYQKQVAQAEKILFFGVKRLKVEPDDSWNIYYDASERYWWDIKRADMMYSYFKKLLPHADWYLGMWGQTYIRLINNMWPAWAIMKGLHNYIRHNMSSFKVNSSSFEGFAILNTLIIDNGGWSQAEDTVKLNIFRNDKTPILMPGWLFIHTAAIWPYGEFGPHGLNNTVIKNVINSADIVGLSTHNSSEEPTRIYYDGDNNEGLFASPPNPLRGATPFVRGMLDILTTFPYWKKVLNRNKLCFSVTTAINYADASSFDMDFRIPPSHTMKMTRRNFTGVHPDNGKLEVELRYMKYEWWDRAASHAWVVRPDVPGKVGPLNAFFAYDDAASLAPKIKEALDAYPDDRCVVFDDLGDDSFAGKFTYNSTTVQFESFDLLKVVSGAMIKKYGGPAFPPQYYSKH